VKRGWEGEGREKKREQGREKAEGRREGQRGEGKHGREGNKGISLPHGRLKTLTALAHGRPYV